MSKSLQLVVFGTDSERTLSTGKLPELDRFVLEPCMSDTLCYVKPCNNTELPSPYRSYVITTLHVGPTRVDLMVVNYVRPVMVVSFRDQVKVIHYIQGTVDSVTDRLINLHHKHTIALLMLVDTEKNTEIALDDESYKQYLYERLTPDQYSEVYNITVRNVHTSYIKTPDELANFERAQRYLGGESSKFVK